MKALLLFLFLIPFAHAQVFVTDRSETHFQFEGNLIKEGISRKGVMTLRQSQDKQIVLMVFEVKDFQFPSLFLYDEFNETFMESQYFPQIRISGQLKEKVDLTQDGIYIVNFEGNFTMRYRPKTIVVPIRMEIKNGSMTFQFHHQLDLDDYQVPYAGVGSDIGKYGDFKFEALLKRTH